MQINRTHTNVFSQDPPESELLGCNTRTNTVPSWIFLSQVALEQHYVDCRWKDPRNSPNRVEFPIKVVNLQWFCWIRRSTVKNPEKTRPLLPCKMSIGVIWCPSTSWTPGTERYLKKMAEEAARWLSRRLEAWIVFDSCVIRASIMRPLRKGVEVGSRLEGGSLRWEFGPREERSSVSYTRRILNGCCIVSLQYKTTQMRLSRCSLEGNWIPLRVLRVSDAFPWLELRTLWTKIPNPMNYRYWKFQEVEDLSKPINMTISYQ